MITALLIVIVVLLIGVLALMLTGWPGRENCQTKSYGEPNQQLHPIRSLLHGLLKGELRSSTKKDIEKIVKQWFDVQTF